MARFKSFLKEIPGAFSKVVGQPILRGYAGLSSLITGKPLTPSTQFQKDLYGTDKPISLRSVGAEFPGIKEKGVLAPIVGAISAGSDLIPGGSSVKKAVTATDKLIDTIKLAGKPREALEAAYTAERSTRAARGTQALQGGGEQGYFGALRELRGELAPKPKFEPVRPLFAQGEVDELFNQIRDSKKLEFFERVSAGDGLRKLLGGEVPPNSQLSILEDVFGPQLVQAVRTHRSGVEKFREGFVNLINVPRALITSIDMSAPLRQGVVLTTTKPSKSIPAFGSMFKYFFSEKALNRWLDDIPNNPHYQLMKDSKLYLADPRKLTGGLAQREEAFMSNLAEKIPLWGEVVKASGRAYTGYLNKLRVDVFTSMANKFAKEGILTPENAKSLANWVNHASGRGSLGNFERVAGELNTGFFSPRLIASRFSMLNPAWYTKQTPAVRKEAIKSMAEFIGIGLTVLMLSKLAGAEVEEDPRSADFGKIRVGNTRWDIWGGFQQWARVFTQMATGERKSTATGRVRSLEDERSSRFNVGLDFLVGKLAPVPKEIVQLLGKELIVEDKSLSDEILENVIPLYLQDLGEAIEDFGPEAIFTVGVPGFFGVGTQTYEKPKKRFGSF